MKKLPYNRQYAIISAYAFLVILASAVCVFCLINYQAVLDIAGKLLNILSPFIWGACLAYLLNPILKTAEKLLRWISRGKLSRRSSRSIGILITYICAIAILAVLLWIILPQLVESLRNLIPQITTWINSIPTLVNDLATKYNLDLNLLTQNDTITAIVTRMRQMVTDFASDLTSIIPQLLQLTSSLVGWVLNLLIIVILPVYLLASKELLYAHVKKAAYALLPRGGVDRLILLTHTANDIFSGFIIGKILDSAIVGSICFIVMALFNWPYAMLISVIVGITNIIPYFGPFIGAIPSILLLLIIDPRTAVMFTIFICILQQIDGNIIGPKILGNTTGLSAFWVIFLDHPLQRAAGADRHDHRRADLRGHLYAGAGNRRMAAPPQRDGSRDRRLCLGKRADHPQGRKEEKGEKTAGNGKIITESPVRFIWTGLLYFMEKYNFQENAAPSLLRRGRPACRKMSLAET